MAFAGQFAGGSGPRRSILDLAPLELHCMNALWPLGEGTVRQIRQRLAPSRPRAYTTIMTIMDRLAHKGVVTRTKVGRAYLYRPNLTSEEARAHAVDQVVAGFFEGSADALAVHLAGNTPRPAPASPRRLKVVVAEPIQPAVVPVSSELSGQEAGQPAALAEVALPKRLDESLL